MPRSEACWDAVWCLCGIHLLLPNRASVLHMCPLSSMKSNPSSGLVYLVYLPYQWLFRIGHVIWVCQSNGKMCLPCSPLESCLNLGAREAVIVFLAPGTFRWFHPQLLEPFCCQTEMKSDWRGLTWKGRVGPGFWPMSLSCCINQLQSLCPFSGLPFV